MDQILHGIFPGLKGQSQYPVPLVFMNPLEFDMKQFSAPGGSYYTAFEVELFTVPGQRKNEFKEITLTETLSRIHQARAATADVFKTGLKAFVPVKIPDFQLSRGRPP